MEPAWTSRPTARRPNLLPASLLAFLLASLAWPPALHAQAVPPAPAVRISEVFPQPEAALGEREFVELRNPGPQAIDLAGWKLRDAPTASGATSTFTFPPWSLAPSEAVVVWGGGEGNGLGPAWTQAAAWNNAGDTVQLLDASGQVVDSVTYGAGATAVAPAPGRSGSLAWNGTAWTVGPPSPGLAVPAQGNASVAVANVPPTATLAAPARVAPGATVRVRATVADANGGADVASWTLSAGGAVLARGQGAVAQDFEAQAPAAAGAGAAGGGAWPILLEATDAAGASAAARAEVEVAAGGGLALRLPPGGALRFPALEPGAALVAALDAFEVRNDGAHSLRPRVDFSAFAGAAAGFAAAGALELGLRAVGNRTGDLAGNRTGTLAGDLAPPMEWVAYAGPLTPLPELAPGQAFEVRLRLRSVPASLPAGEYGTSFAVVA